MQKSVFPAITLVLAAIVALGPLAIDMYLPALPAIGAAFDVGADRVQLTLSVYMAGFALAQLACGALADRFGRKPVLLVGMALFALASLVCVYATSIEMLLLGRFLQAIGGAAGPVLGRAVVRDLYEPRDAARVLSYMGSVMALAPALAPLLGGALLLRFGWNASFVVVAAYALAMMALIAFALPETLAREQRQSIHPGAILRNYLTLVRHREFMGYTLINSMAFGAMFAFISGSSFVLIEVLGVSPQHYGFYFALTVAGMLLGTLVGGRFSRRVGIHRLTLVGTLLVAGGGGVMAALAVSGVYSPLAIVLPHAVLMSGAGILMAQTMAGAAAPFPHMAGTAASLFGFIQMTTAASVGALVGHLHDGTPQPMTLVIAASGCLAFTAFWVMIRPRRAVSQEAVAAEGAPSTPR